jgi:hypothetical protein
MRGVSVRGRRLPANRSAGPARPPVVPAAVSRRSRRGHAVSGFAAAHRTVPGGPTHGTAARRSITTRDSAAHESAAPGAGFAGGSPARWHPVFDRDNDRCPCIGRQPMTCTGSRCRQRSGVSAAVPRDRWASPHCSCPRLRISPPRARPRPEPAGHTICPSGAWTSRPAQARIAGSRGSVPRHRVKPCPPPYQPPLPRGCGHCLAEPGPGTGLAGQHLAGTGYGPVLCPYRQPGATSCRVCRMFPIACYGLTPRCREVKR